MSTSMPSPDRSDALASLLDRDAATGLDLDDAARRVDDIARGRRRTLRSAVGVGTLVLLAAVGAFAALGGNDGDELVADGNRTTTTSISTVSTTTTAVPTTMAVAPPTTVAVASTPVPTTVVATTTTSVPTTTTTTLPPNQRLTATLRVLTPQVQAGEVARVELVWSDRDHTGPAPSATADWAEPALVALNVPTPQPRCDAPGPGGSGTIRREFRYATPGTYRVRVDLVTCGGEGAFAERVRLEGTVTVGPPVVEDRPEVAVVAVAPRTPSGLPVLPALDAAEARFEPTDGAAITLASRAPTLYQFAPSGPATVLRLPAAAVGVLRLTWPGSRCVAEAEVDLTDPPDDTPVLDLLSDC